MPTVMRRADGGQRRAVAPRRHAAAAAPDPELVPETPGALELRTARAELQREREQLQREREASAEQKVEAEIAHSVANLEDQLESVQREAAEVLGLCDSTTAFTNEVRDGLRSARVSMGEQRAAMDSVLASVTGAFRFIHACCRSTDTAIGLLCCI